MQSLLNIDDYFIKEIKIKENPEYKKEERYKSNIKTTLNFKRKARELLFAIHMKIELNKTEEKSSAPPYNIYIDLIGFFSFAEDIDEETAKRMIAINGPVILYGVARGIIANATANFKYGKFVLPTVNFLKMLEHKESLGEKESNKKKV